MEEFTNPTNTPAGVDPDAMRTDNRNVTIEPIHDDIKANSGAIGNIESDREVTNAAGYAAHPDVDPEMLRIKSLPPKPNVKMIMQRVGLALLLLGVACLVYKLLFP
jgi:hypothetical protein